MKEGGRKTVAAPNVRGGVEGARSKKKKDGQGQRGHGPRLQWDASFYFLKNSECDPVRSKITVSFYNLVDEERCQRANL